MEKEAKYNMIFIKGNHDDWLLEGLTTGIHPGATQGGRASMNSYANHCHEGENFGEVHIIVPDDHLKFLKYQHLYYLDDKGNLFIHGGFDRHKLLKDEKDKSNFYWDRDLWHTALSYKALMNGLVNGLEEDEFMDGNKLVFKIKDPAIKQIFIGHTTTMMWHTDQPMNAGPVWNLDTGAGYVGRLTLMDVDTKEFYQSDPVQDLYPDEKGRR
jgi:serine/threonine protein phosphatase 1